MEGAMSETDPAPTDRAETSGPEKLVCDFCGASVARVRRIALDRDYDRLQRPHHAQYACEACSAEKESRRLRRSRG